MHWWKLYLTLNLMLCEITIWIVKAEERPKRNSVGHSSCPRGCTNCSLINGCVTCRRGFFLTFVRTGMRQRGMCVASCPFGYYGVRRQTYSICYRCQIEHCSACFSRSYCTLCQAPYISYRGRCLERCPSGLHYANYSKDCRLIVDCMVGPWSPWSTCSRNGQTCGYKYGITTRTRDVMEGPSPNGASCPALAENRCCRMEMRHCADLLHNNSDLSLDNRISVYRKHKRRRGRKRKRKYRKHRKHRQKRKRKTKSRRRRLRKRKQKLKKRREAWKRFCRRDIVLNDISDVLMYG